jgi:hypothetical protein
MTILAESEQLIINPLVKLWNSEVRPHVSVNACVLSARITSEVFSYFGVKHEVVPMAVMAMNDKMLAHQKAGLYFKEWDADAWSVGVGFGNDMVATNKDSRDANGFDGHLVVATESFYIDLTAYQFDRITQGIETGGSLIVPRGDIEYPFTLSEQSKNSWFHIALKQGHMLFLNNNNQVYKNSPDWRTHYKRQTGDIIRSIRDEISS